MTADKNNKTLRQQAGFTLIEIIAAVAISSLICLGVSVASGQVLNQTSHNNDYTTASRDALNALYWISHDVTMAQTINGAALFPRSGNLTLLWTGWDNTEYSATYTVSDGVLKRKYTENGQVSMTTIASHINTAVGMTTCASSNGTVIIKITSSAGEGDRVIDVTKKREITSRPNL
jgi:prepilin-type N-terminal cleavage/methylation domain-containing protein